MCEHHYWWNLGRKRHIRCSLIYIKHTTDEWNREGLMGTWRGRDTELGNGCIFNGKEREELRVRLRVSSCIIDKTMDIETKSACSTHTLKWILAHTLNTCRPADMCSCTDPGPPGIIHCSRLRAGFCVWALELTTTDTAINNLFPVFPLIENYQSIVSTLEAELS